MKEKGVRVFVEESGYATAFLCNETVQGKLLFSDWLDRCMVSQADYELFQWIADWNHNKENADKISIIGIDITDDIGNIQTLCQYLLKNRDLSNTDVQMRFLLTSIQELNSFSSLALQTFQDELFPQLIELYQTNPAQLKAVLGDQIIPLDRAILGWTEAQEKLRLKEEVEQLGGPDDLYRENCLYEHFMWEYEQHPNAKYYGQFDGVLSLEVGALGNSTTNNAILYNTVLANPPIEKSNKFYSDSPDISDTNFAQYVLLFEDPAKLTVTKERSGAYWKYH